MIHLIHENFYFQLVGQKSDVFVSYCWVNSKISADKGHSRPKLGQVGWGDPRYIKQFLEEHDISCWLDVERTGQEVQIYLLLLSFQNEDCILILGNFQDDKLMCNHLKTLLFFLVPYASMDQL